MNDFVSRLFFHTGIPNLAFRSWSGQGRFVLMFHGVSAKKHLHIPKDIQPDLSADELDFVLTWIKTRFDFLSTRDFFETFKPGVLLTFDDGFANNYTNALSILERHQAPAIYFVTLQHVIDPGDWLPATRRKVLKHWHSEADVDDALAVDFFNGMNVDELRQCANYPLVTIGSHTISHPFLTQCNPTELRIELGESKRLLESLVGRPVDYFAYPTGDYNDRVMDAVRNSGYRAAFVMDTKRLGSSLYEIPRVGLYQADPIYLSLKTSGLHRLPLPVNIAHRN